MKKLSKPLAKLSNSPTGCCEKFNPAPWNNKIITWKNKLFLQDRLFCLFYIPLGFDKLMVKNMEKISSAGALAKKPVLLYDCSSPFGADVFIAIDKFVPNSVPARISGTFLSRVFEGEFKDTGKWVKEMNAYAKRTKHSIKKLYFFYTTCPSCAKYYGHNYVVLLGQL